MGNGRKVRMLVPTEDVSDFQKVFPRFGVWERGPYGREFVVYLPKEFAQQNTDYFSQGLENYRAQRAPKHAPRIVAQTAARAAAQQIPQQWQPQPYYQQQAQPPSPYPPPYQQYPQQAYRQPLTQQEMDRRKFLKITAGIIVGVAATAASVGFLLNSGSRLGQESDPRLYTGTISAKSKGDSKGNLVYYADVCRTADETRTSSYPTLTLGIVLSKDKNPACSPTEGFLSDDAVVFEMLAGKKYEVKNLDREFTSEEIFRRCQLSKKATFRKGELISADSGSVAFFLDRAESIET